MDRLGSAEPREPRAVIPKKRLRRFIFLVLSEVPCVKLDLRIVEVNGEGEQQERVAAEEEEDEGYREETKKMRKA